MATIAVSIIGFNEAENLPVLLDSVKWADEIVYVDCESSDGSFEIAAGRGAKTFRRPNNPNLNLNKQYAIDQCYSDWIIYLDPDEAVSEELAAEIQKTIDSESAADAYFMPRKNYFFGKLIRFGGKYPDRQLRLFRRGKGRFPCESVHERLLVGGAVGVLKGELFHYCIGTHRKMLKKIDFYSQRKLESALKKGKAPSMLKGAKKFAANYFFKLGFLDGKIGFMVAVYDLFVDAFACFKHLSAASKIRN